MDRFTQKLGPLPVWGWAALALLALLAFMYFRKIGPFSGAGAGSSGAATDGSGVSLSSNDLSNLLGSLTADLQALANRGGNPTPPAATQGSSDGIAPSLGRGVNQSPAAPMPGLDRGSAVHQGVYPGPPVYGSTAPVVSNWSGSLPWNPKR